MSWWSSVIRPPRAAVAVSSVSRLSERNSVVLPQPDGPMSASTSPWRTGRSTALTAIFEPYEMVTCSQSIRSIARASVSASALACSPSVGIVSSGSTGGAWVTRGAFAVEGSAGGGLILRIGGGGGVLIDSMPSPACRRASAGRPQS